MKKLLGLGLVGLLSFGTVCGQAGEIDSRDRNVFNVDVDNFKYQYNPNKKECFNWDFKYRKEFIWFVRDGSWVVYKAPSKVQGGSLILVDAEIPDTHEQTTMVFATSKEACEVAISMFKK